MKDEKGAGQIVLLYCNFNLHSSSTWSFHDIYATVTLQNCLIHFWEQKSLLEVLIWLEGFSADQAAGSIQANKHHYCRIGRFETCQEAHWWVSNRGRENISVWSKHLRLSFWFSTIPSAFYSSSYHIRDLLHFSQGLGIVNSIWKPFIRKCPSANETKIKKKTPEVVQGKHVSQLLNGNKSMNKSYFHISINYMHLNSDTQQWRPRLTYTLENHVTALKLTSSF